MLGRHNDRLMEVNSNEPEGSKEVGGSDNFNINIQDPIKKGVKNKEDSISVNNFEKREE